MDANEINVFFDCIEKIKKDFNDKQWKLGIKIQLKFSAHFNPPTIKMIFARDEYKEYRDEANRILLHTSLDLKTIAEKQLIR